MGSEEDLRRSTALHNANGKTIRTSESISLESIHTIKHVYTRVMARNTPLGGQPGRTRVEDAVVVWSLVAIETLSCFLYLDLVFQCIYLASGYRYEIKQ